VNPTAPSTRRPTGPLVRIASMLVVPATVAVAGLLVAQASYSAYSATAVDPTNNWATGALVLTDDDTNTAAFSATNLEPGSTGSRCIVVTSTSTLPSLVKVYGTADTLPTNDLTSHMHLVVTQGSGGSFGSCDGFTPAASGADVYSGTFTDFGMYHSSYANGIPTWTTAGTGDESRTYRISYTVDADAPNSTQGSTASGNFVWEAQTT